MDPKCMRVRIELEGLVVMLFVRMMLFCSALVIVSGFARAETAPKRIQVILETVEYPVVESEWAAKAPFIEAALVLALDGYEIALSPRRTVSAEVGRMDQWTPSAGTKRAIGSQDRVRYLLSVRIEARNGTLQLGGSLSTVESQRAADDIDVEPTKAEGRDLFRAIGVFANNIATVIKKLDEPYQQNIYNIVAGCFSPLEDDVDPVSLEYAARLPMTIGAYLTGGKQFIGHSETPKWNECKSKPSANQVIQELHSDAVVGGVINKSGNLVIVQSMLQGKQAWEYLPLPALRVDAAVPFDSKRALAYSKRIVAYLDGILGKIGSSDLQTITELPVAELLSKARRFIDSKEDGERLYAAALLELAIIRAPSTSEPYFLLGELRYRQKEDEEAVELLKTALAFDWEVTRSGTLLKQLYLRNGLYENARKLCGEISLAQDAGAKNRCLGETYLVERDLDRAFAAYSSAVSEAPNVPDGFYNLGLIEEARKDTDKAIEYYSRALLIDKNYDPAKGKLATTRYAQGIQAIGEEKYSAALEYFSEALNFSSSPLIYFQKGVAYAGLGDLESDGKENYTKAINNFKEARDQLEDVEATLLWLPWLIPDLGELLIVVGEPNEARDWVRAIIPRLNSDAQVRYGTDWRLIKLICDYIEFSAATIMGEDTRVTEKLLRSVMYEVDLKKLGWSFGTMRKYLESKYLKDTMGDELKVREDRANTILRFIDAFEQRRKGD